MIIFLIYRLNLCMKSLFYHLNLENDHFPPLISDSQLIISINASRCKLVESFVELGTFHFPAFALALFSPRVPLWGKSQGRSLVLATPSQSSKPTVNLSARCSIRRSPQIGRSFSGFHLELLAIRKCNKSKLPTRILPATFWAASFA